MKTPSSWCHPLTPVYSPVAVDPVEFRNGDRRPAPHRGRT
ncbi:hypothetical protein HMPREF9585_00197 [Cutibacterium acnes HL083PA1]|nr:hypothetical protein HMPREF9585_00197 [Cutibacterium acnes HL083PA1]